MKQPADQIHTGQHIRWAGDVMTVLHEPALGTIGWLVHVRPSHGGHDTVVYVPEGTDVESADRGIDPGR